MIRKFYAKHTIIAEESNKILEVAKRLGIILPSTHTALFQSVYAPIEEANLNGVRLARKAVEDGISGLIGSQVNLEHYGYGWIVGIILDAWVNDTEEIEIVYSFAKNIYKDEYAMALEALTAGTLSVSFELLAETSMQQQLPDGSIRLHEVDFQGVGMLITHPPAYPKAKTYEYATLIKERVEHNEDKTFIFANQVVKTCEKILKEGVDSNTENTNALTNSSTELDKHIDVLKNEETKDESEQGGNSQVTEEQKAKIEELRAELGDSVNDISDEDLLDDSIVAKIREEIEAKKAEEAKEEKAEEKTEETAEEKEETAEEKTEEKAEETDEKAEETEEKADSEEKVEEKSEQDVEIAQKVDSVEIRTYSIEEKDGVENVVETVKIMTTRDYNAMQEAVAKVEELETTLQAKDSEIEEIRANAEKVGQRKVQLEDNEFASEFKDEDYLDEEKVAKAIQDKEDSEIIATRKEELKENEYAKDFTDEDYLNEDKVELAKVKAEKDELKAKVSENKEEIKAEKEEEKAEENLDTGKEEKDENKFGTVMAEIRKQKAEARESQTVITKE